VPDDPISEMTPSFSASFEAEAGNVLRDNPTSAFMRGVELARLNTPSGDMAAGQVREPLPARASARAQPVKPRLNIRYSRKLRHPQRALLA